MSDQERTAKIAILRELLDSGPKHLLELSGRGAYGFNRAVAEWRDHITAKIKKLEGAGE